MSVPLLDVSLSTDVSTNDVFALCKRVGLEVSEEFAEACRPVIGALDGCAKVIMARDDHFPGPDEIGYPRKDIQTDIDNSLDGGGWATKVRASGGLLMLTCTKVNVKSTQPESNLLQGRTLALKDNIALAGVRCTNGTDLSGWVPDFDATVVKRILDCGGTILGKAACESGCWSTVSDTSITGPVRNPYHDEFSCGGSSSGSARLVACRSVDMALGGDQGGSIRVPASACGIVGLKPTWGLVPYTGILGVSAVIDHVGPMARTVADCALLLEAIAGPDGIDDRQPHINWFRSVPYADEVRQHSTTADPRPLAGVKIGVLEEGFQHPRQDDLVARVVRQSIDKFEELGAEVRTCHVPEHRDTELAWMCTLPAFAFTQGLVLNSGGRKQFAMSGPAALGNGGLSQSTFDVLNTAGQNLYLRGCFLQEKYGAALVSRCTNLMRKLSDDYDVAFRQFDVLVMPTTPLPPCRIFKSRSEGSTSERLKRTTGITANTAPFNASGHPALSIPVGFSPALEDPSVRLPVGLQLVGRKFEDALLLKVAASWENRYDWKAQ
ncbi:uncharacterized protein PV06_05310 [Exophiala oligosperma]|uniref:Amidase domain-containing protein n=1 Tax=Exophiala oligosperma TaxID=215243 RepID=A0A0D2DP20_9EURO|nr:uncharacterized protein PV06_05310 [Exophiala oligosperma]KIW44290.1 hypothetical protein PV06_05310 [Exophiala oligosperma]